MKKLLITGFEPFNGHLLNPSQELVQNLPNQLGNLALIKAVLPVQHTLAPDRLLALLNDHQPEAVLAFGLAANRTKISLERVAINLMDYRIPDNTGVTITNQPIDPHGPAAYFSTLPLEALSTALNHAGAPVEISLSAGAYLCNQVFYTLMHAIAKQNLNIPAGFIHLPALGKQASESPKTNPLFSLDMLINAAHLIIHILYQAQAT
ncbi:MAG: pyroglutamyl-peptidase I [Brevefilum sp.]